jgi:hypothetical protein
VSNLCAQVASASVQDVRADAMVRAVASMYVLTHHHRSSEHEEALRRLCTHERDGALTFIAVRPAFVFGWCFTIWVDQAAW